MSDSYYTQQGMQNFPLLNTKTTYFFHLTLSGSNKLDPALKKSESFSVFETNIKFVNSIYDCDNPKKGSNSLQGFGLA